MLRNYLTPYFFGGAVPFNQSLQLRRMYDDVSELVGKAVSANGARRLSNRSGQPNPSLVEFDLTVSTRNLAVIGIWER